MRLASTPGSDSASAAVMAKRSSAGVMVRAGDFCQGSLATTKRSWVNARSGESNTARAAAAWPK